MDNVEARNPIIDPQLVPEHTKADIGAVGWETFKEYCRQRREDPELERRHQELVAQYEKRRGSGE